MRACVIVVSVKNESHKQVKSIQAVLQTLETAADDKDKSKTKKSKEKEKKPVQAGKHEEWYQGNR